MAELLLRIQQACLDLNGWYLVLPGVSGVGIGLFLWLGGARYAWLVAGLLGALGGAALGSLLATRLGVRPWAAVLIGAAALTLLALLLRQVVMVVLAAAVFALIFGSSYVGYALDNSVVRQWREGAAVTPLAPSSGPRQAQPSDQSHQRALAQLQQLVADLHAWAAGRRGMLLLWGLAGAALGVLLGFILKKIVMALCCSIVGSAGVIVGTSMLLFGKGAAVVSSLQTRPRLLPSLFVVMILFGLAVQLLLAAAVRTIPAQSVEKPEQKKEEKP